MYFCRMKKQSTLDGFLFYGIHPIFMHVKNLCAKFTKAHTTLSRKQLIYIILLNVGCVSITHSLI